MMTMIQDIKFELHAALAAADSHGNEVDQMEHKAVIDYWRHQLEIAVHNKLRHEMTTNGR